MAKNASFIQYMRAHGNTPGPTQRPIPAGAVSGLVSEIPTIAILWWAGAWQSAAESLGTKIWLLLLLHTVATVVAGALYGRVFSRAANDPHGGWLFGISYGFLLWLVGPATALQLTFGRPLAVGGAAIGILTAHIGYGLALGLTYPWIHRSLQSKLSKTRPLSRRKGIFGIKPDVALIPRSRERVMNDRR